MPPVCDWWSHSLFHKALVKGDVRQSTVRYGLEKADPSEMSRYSAAIEKGYPTLHILESAKSKAGKTRVNRKPQADQAQTGKKRK